MGRYTADQLAAIRAGQPVRQTWDIYVPTSSAHSAYDAVPLDAGLYAGGAAQGLTRIVRAGSRKFEAWNPSPMVQNKPKAVRYSFTARNNDRFFYRAGGAGSAWYSPTGSYQAEPQECRVEHTLYVLLLTGVWSELSFLTFIGQVRALHFEDGSDADREPSGKLCTVTTEQVGAWSVLRRPFSVNDADDEKVAGTASAHAYGDTEVDWTVP